VNETQRILADALDLLNGGQNWIKGAYSDWSDGKRSYCSLGAVDAALYRLRDYSSNPWLPLTEAAIAVANRSVVGLNDDDDTEFPLIEQMFTKAIELAAGE
jgi:hypothetical protein